ncbi:MAG: pilus assembly PilX family protein [Steroidobacteraceae bacterium]
MNNHPSSLNHASRQSGVVMFVALILLLILSLLGVTAARMQTVEERMARNDDNRQLGAEAAEAALRNAENGLSTSAPQFIFPGPGLYQPNLSTGSPVATMNWAVAANTVPYGGPPLSSVPAPTQAPKVAVEQLASIAVPGDDTSVVGLNPPTPPITVYRVTAQGVGADGTSTTTLQSIFR